jgi:hypothetical protein
LAEIQRINVEEVLLDDSSSLGIIIIIIIIIIDGDNNNKIGLAGKYSPILGFSNQHEYARWSYL